MAFEERTLQITFKIGLGNFGLAGFDTLTVEGVRATARITNAGGAMKPSLDLIVYGLTLAQMNQLSTLGQRIDTQRRNVVLVLAGTVGGPLTNVFMGNITNAWIDAAGSPDVPLRVQAVTMGLESVQPVEPTSFAQEVAAEDVLAQLAQKIGWQFENNGVHVMLPISYFPRSPREQILAVIQHAGIAWNGGEGGVLAIWPRGGARAGSNPIVSPSTGMRGYPTFTQNGIKFQTLFNPDIRHGIRLQVKDSMFTNANGNWDVNRIDHSLSSQTPGGPWFSDVDCAIPGILKAR